MGSLGASLVPDTVPPQAVIGSGIRAMVDKKAAREWARDKLSQMTLEEKVSLLAGDDLWRTPAVRRLGVPKLKTSDGPVGVRGGIFADGVTAASLPTG